MRKEDPEQMSIFVDTPYSITESESFTKFLDNNTPPTEGINYVFGKAWNILRNRGMEYPVIMASISGGSDSDLMIDMLERVGHPNSIIHYVFFNTGMEYMETKRHIKYLESRYGVQITECKAKMPVPVAVHQYGYPFLAKKVSNYIHRLQSNGFSWEDGTFEKLLEKYPKCEAALKWWCNEWGDGSRFNISRRKWLKEFLIENPPTIPISDMCCIKSKEDTAHQVEKELNPNLSCVGVRKSEGGQRAIIGSCFTDIPFGCSVFRPLYWIQKNDKRKYERFYQIRHSGCYTVYGLKRTGCACCPFGRNFEQELEIAQRYEPKLYKAACNVFGPVYEYTKMYKEFVEKKETITSMDESQK